MTLDALIEKANRWKKAGDRYDEPVQLGVIVNRLSDEDDDEIALEVVIALCEVAQDAKFVIGCRGGPGHDDPDNSGLCIKCGLPSVPDPDDRLHLADALAHLNDVMEEK